MFTYTQTNLLWMYLAWLQYSDDLTSSSERRFYDVNIYLMASKLVREVTHVYTTKQSTEVVTLLTKRHSIKNTKSH